MSSQNQMFDKSTESKNQLDRYIKSKISVLDFQPPPIEGWNKTATWETIKKQLGSSNKNAIAWGMALAASMSLVVAASINFSSIIFSETPPKEIAHTNLIEESLPSTVLPSSKRRKVRAIDQLTKINTPYHIPTKASAFFPISIQEVKLPAATLVHPKTKTNKTFIKPLVKLDYSSLSSTPDLGFGIDFDIYSKMTGSIKKDIRIGLSTSFNQISNEHGSQVRAFTFLNAEYSKMDVNREKGWSVRTGILLNNGGNVYKKNAVKFSVNRQFNRHVKAGPEVIFTENLTKIYPGVSIIFS